MILAVAGLGRGRGALAVVAAAAVSLVHVLVGGGDVGVAAAAVGATAGGVSKLEGKTELEYRPLKTRIIRSFGTQACLKQKGFEVTVGL